MVRSTRASIARYRRLLKNALTDYRWTLYYLQRMDYHPTHREAVAAAVSKFLPKSSANALDSHTTEVVQQLRTDGIAFLDGLVSSQQVNAIREYLSTKLCYDPCRPELSGFTDPSDAHPWSVHAYYSPDDLPLPQILEIANHPTILGSLETLFRAKPTIANIQVWWVLHGFDMDANAGEVYSSKPGEFHRDADDWAQFKLYVYLTDVDETGAPHAFVRGSQRWNLPIGKRCLQLQDPSYPIAENLQIITGNAGLAWLENAYCLHRATIAQKKHRLILTISYGLVPWPFWRGSVAVPVDDSRFDPYTNRIFMHR
jgi:hypothetical protein